MNLFPNFTSTEQAVEYVQDNFLWSLRDPSALSPRLFPPDYHSLCPRFDHRMAMRYAYDYVPPNEPSYFGSGYGGDGLDPYSLGEVVHRYKEILMLSPSLRKRAEDIYSLSGEQ